jgi:hypothetical protein
MRTRLLRRAARPIITRVSCDAPTIAKQPFRPLIGWLVLS